MTRTKLVRKLWLIPFFMIGFGIATGFIISGLWNWIMPAVFGLGMITFWQAIGLLILVRLLIGGFRKRSHWRMRRHQMAYVHCQPQSHGPHQHINRMPL